MTILPTLPEPSRTARRPSVTAGVLLSLLAVGATLLVVLEPGRRPPVGEVQITDADRFGGPPPESSPLIAIEPSQFPGLQEPALLKSSAAGRGGSDVARDSTPRPAAVVPGADVPRANPSNVSLPDATLSHAGLPNANLPNANLPALPGAAGTSPGVVSAGPVKTPDAPALAARSSEAAAAAAGPLPSPARGAVDPALLMERGTALLARSDISSARLFFRLAAEQGSAAGALAMAATYDPLKVTGAGIGSAGPDARAAVEWYRRASQLGDRDADAPAARLLDVLGRRAATGDAGARAALDALTQ